MRGDWLACWRTSGWCPNVADRKHAQPLALLPPRLPALQLPLSAPPPPTLAGILFALLHVPQLVATIPGAQADVEGALRYVLTLECDAEGRRGEPGRRVGGEGSVVDVALMRECRQCHLSVQCHLCINTCTYVHRQLTKPLLCRPPALHCRLQRAGQGGHYPTQMGPWRDREPLVHWCHGATGGASFE